MNVKTTIVLVILLAAGLTYLAVTQMGWLPSAGPHPAAPADTFAPLTDQTGNIVELTIDSLAGKTVLLRHDDGWVLGGPDAPADKALADSAVGTFTTLRYVSRYAPGSRDYPKDDQTSLSAPLGTVSFKNDKGQANSLKIGRPVALTANQRYVQLGGSDDVYVIEPDVMAALNRSPDDYRDKSVCPFKTEQAQRIVIHARDQYTLVKTDGKWAIESPSPGRAVEGQVTSLLSAMAGLKASRFVENAPSSLVPYKLDDPRVFISVDLSETPTTPAASAPAAALPIRTVTLQLSSPIDGKVFGKLAQKSWIFQVDAAQVAALQPRLLDMRDKSVLDIGLQEIARLELQPAGQPAATLEKIDGNWKMTAPFAGPAQPDAVEKLVKTIQDLKASDYADAAGVPVLTGLEKPAARIAISLRGSDKTITLLLGVKTPSGQMGYAQEASSKTVAVIPADSYDVLTQAPSAYWQRKLLELPPPAGLAELRLQRGGQNIVVAQTAFGQYQMTAPLQAKADFDNVEAILSAAQSLQANKLVSLDKQLPQRFENAAGRITAEFVFAQNPPPATTSAPASGLASAPASAPASQPAGKTFVLAMVKEGGKTYLWRPDQQTIAVGEADGAVYDYFDAELRDRAAFAFASAKVTGLTITAGDKTLQLVRNGGDWADAADRFVKIDNRSVQKFLDDLAAVKAVRFVQINPQKADLDKPAKSLRLELEDGKSLDLKVSNIGPENSSDLYALGSDSGGVFVIPAESAKNISANLADFQAKAPAPELPSPMGNPMGGE